MSVNVVILEGHLGATPDMRFLDSGSAVAELRLAVNETWKDKNGTMQEKCNWISVQCWQKLAETVTEHLIKGSRVLVEGRLSTRSWDDKKTGEKRYAVDVTASKVTFLDPKESKPQTEEDPF